ncbi:hypothetical protein [Aurantiacibacter hainanensis]|uniref:hypothetical protein n=1 Tax=Aurantiacibacter hainanensis TaxID=3076114 RepID=UPI0030C74B01
MDWGSPEFVIAIVAVSMLGWIINNWIRAKHGYPLEDEWGGKSERIEKSDSREAEMLREQNKQLRDVMERMEDRMIVLERIVTDKGYTVAEEIEALRDKPGRNDRESGVQLNFEKKEQA